MADIVNQPRLEIPIIDDTWAEIRAYFDIDWNAGAPIDDFHRILVEVYGEDDGIAGGEGFVGDREEISDGIFDTQGDDYLLNFPTLQFYPLRGRILTVTAIQRVQRNTLDEDKGWGVIKRLRKRRDKDEIYVRGRLEVRNTSSFRGWRYLSQSQKSNVVKERF
jgi:hypothetical protein